MRNPGCKNKDAEMIRCTLGCSAPRTNLRVHKIVQNVEWCTGVEPEKGYTKHELRQNDGTPLVCNHTPSVVVEIVYVYYAVVN
jgi:hypothetical protein